MQVIVIDLLCITPHYDRYLCEALSKVVANLTFYSIEFRHEKNYLEGTSFKLGKGLINISESIPHQGIRRLVKVMEYLFNWLIIIVKCSLDKPDVIHIQWLPLIATKWKLELLFIRIVKGLRIPIVYTVHNYLPHEHKPHHKDNFLQIYNIVDGLIVHTAKDKNDLVTDMQIPEDKISLVPMGSFFHDHDLDISLNGEPRIDRHYVGAGEKSFIILSLGVIRPYKNIINSIHSIHLLCMQKKDVKLLVVGNPLDKEHFHEIQDLVKNLELSDNVFLYPHYVSTNLVIQFHNIADLILLPYSHISQSASLLTAGGLGKCVLVSETGGLGEVIQDMKNGIVVKDGSVESIVEGISRYISSSPETRTKLGSTLKEHIDKNFSWEVIAHRTLHVYRSVLNTKGSRDK